VARLEKIFKALGETPAAKMQGMAGLIEEGAEMIAEDPDGGIDAGLISVLTRRAL